MSSATTELFSTYGWVFFLILFLVGTTLFFGVARPDIIAPNRCSLQSTDVACEDFIITTMTRESDSIGIMAVTIRQTAGRTIFVDDFRCSSIRGSDVISYYLQGDDLTDTSLRMSQLEDNDQKRQWDPNRRKTFMCYFSNQGQSPFIERSNERIPITLSIRRGEDGFVHRIEGSIAGSVR